MLLKTYETPLCREHDYINNSNIFNSYMSGYRFGILDIETTGLDPRTAIFVLGGIAYIDGENLITKQFFAESPEDEANTLSAYFEEISTFDVILTYNGKHFDAPFLIERFKRQHIDMDLSFPWILDLYLILNGHSNLRSFLPNLKQKTVEDYMGLWSLREDQISGADSVRLYYDFLSCSHSGLKAQLLETILLHNRDDILQLSRLLPTLEKVDLHKAMFALGFPVFHDSSGLATNKIKLTGKALTIEGVMINLYENYENYQFGEASCHISLESSPYEIDRPRGYSGSFSLEIPIKKLPGVYFVDLLLFPGDFTLLKKYPAFENNCLVFQHENGYNYREINDFVKILLLEVLREAKHENTIKIG